MTRASRWRPVRSAPMRRPPRPNRSTFRRRAASAAAVLGLVLVAAGCSDGSDGAASTTTAARPTTTTAPATTVAVPTTFAPPVGRPEAKDAAQTLYDAWVAGDRVTASQVADPAAVEAVFAAAPGNYQLYRGCDTGEFDTGGCLFRDRGNNNTIQIDVEKRDGQWVVATAFFSAG